MKKIYLISFILLLNLTSCATVHISSDDAQLGEAAIRKFSEYDLFFIKPLVIDLKIKADYNNEKATKVIEEGLFKELFAVFGVLDPVSEYDPSKPQNTLIIEPTIEKMKSVSGAARVFTGVLAGGSAVVLKTTYIDAETNKIIAAPSFYQQANAWGAAYSVGRSDRAMLDRIASLAASYAQNNY